MINNSAQGIVCESITLYVLLEKTRTVESSSEDLRKQAREEQQVSDFDQPVQWKPNGANETERYKFAIRWIPNGDNEAVLTSGLLQWIPNGANEAAILLFVTVDT